MKSFTWEKCESVDLGSLIRITQEDYSDYFQYPPIPDDPKSGPGMIDFLYDPEKHKHYRVYSFFLGNNPDYWEVAVGIEIVG
jgi:hypothetical protein